MFSDISDFLSGYHLGSQTVFLKSKQAVFLLLADIAGGDIVNQLIVFNN